MEDTEGYEMELRYFRDIEGREVDFVVVKDRQPILFVECKMAEKQCSPHLRYLKKKFPSVRAVQVHARIGAETVITEGIELIAAPIFLGQMV